MNSAVAPQEDYELREANEKYQLLKAQFETSQVKEEICSLLWHIFVQHPDDKQLIELIGEYLTKEGRDLEIINEKGMNVRSIGELEGCKGKLRAGLYVMIKRMQIVFG